MDNTRKHLTAQELLDELLLIAKDTDLSKVKVNYRRDYNTDVVPVEIVAEDAYDEKTNNILESICFVTNADDEGEESEKVEEGVFVTLSYYTDEDGDKIYDLEGMGEDLALGISRATDGELLVSCYISED